MTPERAGGKTLNYTLEDLDPFDAIVHESPEEEDGHYQIDTSTAKDMKGSHVYAKSDKKDKMSLKVLLNNKRDRTTLDLVELDKNMVSEIFV